MRIVVINQKILDKNITTKMVEKDPAASHARTENKRTKVNKGVKFREDDLEKLGGEHAFAKHPEWLKVRLAFFDRLFAEQ